MRVFSHFVTIILLMNGFRCIHRHVSTRRPRRSALTARLLQKQSCGSASTGADWICGFILALFPPFCQITVILLNGRYGELIHIRQISMPQKGSVHFVRRRGDVRGDKCCSTSQQRRPPSQHPPHSGTLPPLGSVLVMVVIYLINHPHFWPAVI